MKRSSPCVRVRITIFLFLTSSFMADAKQGVDRTYYRQVVDGVEYIQPVDATSVKIIGPQSAEARGKSMSAPGQTVSEQARFASGKTVLSVKREKAFSRDELGSLVAEAKRDGSFVSPVLRDYKGDEVYLTNSILVGFAYPSDDEARQHVLDSIPGIQRAEIMSSPLGLKRQIRDFYGKRPGEIFQGSEKASPRSPKSISQSVRFLYQLPEPKEGVEVYHIDLDSHDGFDILDLLDELTQNPDVVFAEPDSINVGSSSYTQPNDGLFYATWQLEQNSNFDLNALTFWDVTIGYSSIKVGVLDCGIQTSHPDLNLAPGRNFAPDAGSGAYGPQGPNENHGTAVAGVISGKINNTIGTVGLAPGVRVVPLRVGFNYTSSGSFNYQTSSISDALDWAASQNCRVTNTSLNLVPNSGISQSYNNTRSNNQVVHCACTGNDYPSVSGINYPASLNSVIGVGASTTTGSRRSSSQFGTGISMTAPGSDIITTDRTGSAGYINSSDYVVIDGTSFASPMVAATAALILSKNPGLTAAQVQGKIQGQALDAGASGYDTEYGYGHLRTLNALNATAAGLWYAAGAVDTGGGWKYQAAFGAFNDEAYPWYYHNEHGSQVAGSDDPADFWFYDNASGQWFWTDLVTPVYPFIARNDGVWFYYQVGSSNPRWFQNVSTGQWVNF